MDWSGGVSILGVGLGMALWFMQMTERKPHRWVVIVLGGVGVILMLVWPAAFGLVWLQESFGMNHPRWLSLGIAIGVGSLIGGSVFGGAWFMADPARKAPSQESEPRVELADNLEPDKEHRRLRLAVSTHDRGIARASAAIQYIESNDGQKHPNTPVHLAWMHDENRISKGVAAKVDVVAFDRKDRGLIHFGRNDRPGITGYWREFVFVLLRASSRACYFACASRPGGDFKIAGFV